MQVSIVFVGAKGTRTVEVVLAEKLGRQPTHDELVAEVKRILAGKD